MKVSVGYKGKGEKTKTFTSWRNREYPVWKRKKEMPVSCENLRDLERQTKKEFQGQSDQLYKILLLGQYKKDID